MRRPFSLALAGLGIAVISTACGNGGAVPSVVSSGVGATPTAAVATTPTPEPTTVPTSAPTPWMTVAPTPTPTPVPTGYAAVVADFDRPGALLPSDGEYPLEPSLFRSLWKIGRAHV